MSSLLSTAASTTLSVAATATSAAAAATSSSAADATRNPVYKPVGIALAVASGVFIGISFVLKKVGLLKANVKYNEEAGEGYGYLKNAYWWTGMILMIIGEFCNFGAYAFVDAILVTPLGALSVVITTILSAIFLKERLSFVGKAGCFICIVGSTVIVLNAPAQSAVATIQEMQSFVIAPGFLSYAGVVIVGCAFTALWAGPRYGKKSMMVYLTVCSFIGGLSVVATQGLGAAIVAQAGGTPQFNQWFLYVLLVFVIATLVTEIIYLNKALNIYNAALVTPTYYVYFTTTTIVTSVILFRGLHGTVIQIITMVLGFLQICSGVILLQLSKSSKDVPDAAVFSGDLDQVRVVAEQEEPESEPRADAIRGTAAIIRRISQARAKRETKEAIRIHEDKMKERMAPISENEQFEWDGLRRRKTTISKGSLSRKKTVHPPLGMARTAEQDEQSGFVDSGSADYNVENNGFNYGFRKHDRSQRARFGSTSSPEDDDEDAWKIDEIRKRTTSWHVDDDKDMTSSSPSQPGKFNSIQEVELGNMRRTGSPLEDTEMRKPVHFADGTRDRATSGASVYTRSTATSHPADTTQHGTRRQFSFQNILHPHRRQDVAAGYEASTPRSQGQTIRAVPREHTVPERVLKQATEEERLGLVKGDTNSSAGTSAAHSREHSASAVLTPQFSDELDDDEDEEGNVPLRSAFDPRSTSRYAYGSEFQDVDTSYHTDTVERSLPPTPLPGIPRGSGFDFGLNDDEHAQTRRDPSGTSGTGSGRSGGGAFI